MKYTVAIIATVACLCLAAEGAQPNFALELKCSKYSECLCKVPTLVKVAAGKPATIRFTDNAGTVQTVDLSKTQPQIAEYCRRLATGEKPPTPTGFLSG